MARSFLRASFPVIAAGIVLAACGVGTEGLGPIPLEDAAAPDGSLDPGSSDGSGLADASSFEGSAEEAEASPAPEPPEAATPFADATDAIVNVGADSSTGGPDANGATPDAAPDANGATPDATPDAASGNEASTDATADRDEAASDAPGDVGSAPEASGTDDAGSDANSCRLPTGATSCCGSVPCTNHGGSCSTPGICAKCVITCTPALPICCALGGLTTKCEVKVTDC